MKLPVKLNGHGSLYKEVRFSPAASPPARRAQSMTDGNRRPRTLPGSIDLDISAYIDQSRTLLESQRQAFEQERATFSEERKLWDKERQILQAKIAALEAAVSASNSSRANFGPSPFGPARIAPPQNGNPWLTNNGHHVWEGSSPDSKPTRVFPDDTKSHELQLPTLEENGPAAPPSLDAALSPRSRPVDRSVSVSVPIEKLDSKLDGITLKLSGLPPDVVARVMTPPSPSPTEPTTEITAQKPEVERKPSTARKISLAELGPPDENLKRDAGHTPMAVIGTDTDASNRSPSTVDDELEIEAPLAPQQTLVVPVEKSESYFPDVRDVEDDPALKGPLALQNDDDEDHSFLAELDEKLLGEARKAVGHSEPAEPDAEDDAGDEQLGQADPEPQLKLRQTTNFGTAFGTRSDCRDL